MKTSIVIAESHGLLRDLLALAVATESHAQVVGTCESGEKALALCEEFDAGLLVIGCALSDMSASNLLKLTKSKLADLRVMMLTGDANGEVLDLPTREQPHGIFHRNDPLPVFYDVLRAVARGARYHSSQAIHHAPGANANGNGSHVKLTGRERDVLTLLARGRSSKQIAHQLSLSPKTVDHYRADLMKKLDIHDVAGLTRHALKAGLVSLE